MGQTTPASPGTKTICGWHQQEGCHSGTETILIARCVMLRLFQGVLGDCWLLSTCAALAKKEELMYRVIDPNQVLYGPGYTGLVRVNVWRYGHWVTVYIDDRYTFFYQATKNAKNSPYSGCRSAKGPTAMLNVLILTSSGLL